MNARTHLPADVQDAAAVRSFVFASYGDANAGWLAQALGSAGELETVPLDPAQVAQQVSMHSPAVLLIDFSGGRAAAASAVAAAAHLSYPGLPLIAVGTLAEPESALAALRAGVRDFVDRAAPADEALRIVRQVIENRIEPVQRHGRLTVMLGARVGMGVTTLAANLGALLARGCAAHNRQTALLDLGLPAGDGAMMLNMGNDFSFVDAVRNLRRFDQTFVHTALSRHTSGLALTTLPVKLGEMREVSYASAVALLNRLRGFFDHQLVDLGGFANDEFVAQVVQAADETWLVCDQGVASIVSAAAMLDTLREGGVDLARVQLIVNRYEPELDLKPAQIAARLNLELLAALPARRIELCQAANRGQLLAEAAPRDPYVRALDALAARSGSKTGRPAATGGVLRRILSHTSKRV